MLVGDGDALVVASHGEGEENNSECVGDVRGGLFVGVRVELLS